MNTIDLNGKPFHFIGVGGIGMSALAHVLAKRGVPISGSDLKSTHITERLESMGAKIFFTQEASNIDQLYQINGKKDQKNLQVVCSTAINNNNSEYQAVIEKGYPIFHRSDLLAALIKDYQSIAVAGTHGKTTTSSMIGYMLLESKLDPTVIVGGEVSAWGGNARLGDSNLLVAEADESDGSLIKHSPTMGIITNIELDHPDHYKDLNQLVDIFNQFSSQSDLTIACIDCPVVKENIKANITYSINPDSGANYIATNIVHQPKGSQAQVWENGQLLGNISLLLSGNHNVSNALSAIAVGRKLGLDFDTIAQALSTFDGAKRRFEYKGKFQGATLIDDYAHHPSEIRCTLEAARTRLPQYDASRVVAIFQPHRYSRTETFLEDFARCFASADVVILTDIYSAGEDNKTGITGQKLAETVEKYHDEVIYYPQLSSLKNFLADFLQPTDLTLFLGAGNLNQTIAELLKLEEDSLLVA
ncbi:UDP-N-acetylmuramate--L-alanine ligase [Cyanobacterium stanieri LEGE 03274]|uniref:UDP-N-acetylmuramate--L-alanine ligase n=1 Tax=Cyanobacterium stanieri LEGE 03274 TaxID=1828756 RepID=A0ABR9V325_9CHRO|nr:UDP-N-acetylmuramate--L-alanine ligase [Cyanobacterium stanieri LEGE 03274]